SGNLPRQICAENQEQSYVLDYIPPAGQIHASFTCPANLNRRSPLTQQSNVKDQQRPLPHIDRDRLRIAAFIKE
ncbi:MAG: hypothetical protein P8Z30_14935, partial [Acidobacteriota bacterium]